MTKSAFLKLGLAAGGLLLAAGCGSDGNGMDNTTTGGTAGINATGNVNAGTNVGTNTTGNGTGGTTAGTGGTTNTTGVSTTNTGMDGGATTSTTTTGGATMEDLKLMVENSGENVQVKAAGGVRTLDDTLRVKELGVTRIGATATAAIVDAARERFGE